MVSASSSRTCRRLRCSGGTQRGVVDETEFTDEIVVEFLANTDALQAVEDLASRGEVDERFGARQRPDEPTRRLTHVEQDGLKGAAVGPGADGLARRSGSQRKRPSSSAGIQAHRAGRHAIGELQQQIAVVQAIKRLQAAFNEMLTHFIGSKGGAIDAEDFSRHVGAKAKGAIPCAAVAVAEIRVFLHVPEAEIAEVDGLVRKQRPRYIDGTLWRKHAEVGFEQVALRGRPPGRRRRCIPKWHFPHRNRERYEGP